MELDKIPISFVFIITKSHPATKDKERKAMISPASTPDEYISLLPPERQEVIQRMREVIRGHIPSDFEETVQYGILGWAVPLSIYPAGYHTTGEPLPFLGIAAQKNFYALYHMGLYEGEDLLEWFQSEYEQRMGRKLDAGKSCLRFKKPEHVPYELIGELAEKISATDFARSYAKFDPRNQKGK